MTPKYDEKMENLLKELFSQQQLIRAIFSNARKKSAQTAIKIEIRPLMLKGVLAYQVSKQIATKVLHTNYTPQECLEVVMHEFIPQYKQALVSTATEDYHLLMGKKGNVNVTKSSATIKQIDVSHNRTKNYILAEGQPLPFLIALGLMTNQGAIIAKKRDKFIQINRFLEIVSDILPALDKLDEIAIVDFGCGKAYLTFALYHFLTTIKGFNVQLTGVDLKADVVGFCNQLSQKMGFYPRLQFAVGDIADCAGIASADMVVALHACNTATDYALHRAIQWGAKVILAAPCCQHELMKQIKCRPLDAILDYGILKERLAALATDAARAKLLEMAGYTTQILEFIDAEHTPKNLLIRGVWTGNAHRQVAAKESYQALKSTLGVTPMLEILLA